MHEDDVVVFAASGRETRCYVCVAATIATVVMRLDKRYLSGGGAIKRDGKEAAAQEVDV